jgi:hypothetical protein
VLSLNQLKASVLRDLTCCYGWNIRTNTKL